MKKITIRQGYFMSMAIAIVIAGINAYLGYQLYAVVSDSIQDLFSYNVLACFLVVAMVLTVFCVGIAVETKKKDENDSAIFNFKESAALSSTSGIVAFAIFAFFYFTLPFTSTPIQPWYGITAGETLPDKLTPDSTGSLLTDSLLINGVTYQPVVDLAGLRETFGENSIEATGPCKKSPEACMHYMADNPPEGMPEQLSLWFPRQSRVITGLRAVFVAENEADNEFVHETMLNSLQAAYPKPTSPLYDDGEWIDKDITSLKLGKRKTEISLTVAVSESRSETLIASSIQSRLKTTGVAAIRAGREGMATTKDNK